MRWIRWGLSIWIACVACLLSSQRAWAGAIADGPNVRVTDAGLNGGSVDNPRIVEQNGTLYAVWEDDRDGNFRGVYFAKSTNGGESWGPNIRVSQFPFDDWANYPDIAVQPDGTIWVVWHTFYDDDSNQINDIRIAKSTDGGATFAVNRLLNGTDGDSDLWRARVVADASNGALYVMSQLWDIEGDNEGMNLFVLRYVAATDSWEPTIINDVARAGRIDDSSTQDYGAWFSLTARNGILCAAWEDRGRAMSERQPIYGACSTDGGTSFAADFKISEDDGIRPEIALGPDGELYAAYAIDTDSHANIKLRLSTDKGVTWQPTRPVTTVDSFEIRDWTVGVDANGQVLLAYAYDLGSSSDLYLATSIDQGVNLAYLNLEDGTGTYPSAADHFGPALATGGTGDDTHGYVVWEDDRDSDSNLWSERLILDSLPPTTPTNIDIAPEERALRLSWDPSTDTTGVAGYRVYRATTADGPFTEITPQLVTPTTYVDMELDGATYFYKVAAVDGTGNTSPLSTVVSGVALAAGDPTFDGKLAYEAGDTIRVRNLRGDPAERTMTDAHQPSFAANGERIYYISQETISSQPTDGGTPEIFFANEGLYEYDLADKESHYGVIIGRTFASPGAIGGICTVSEPHYGRPGQELYTEQYDYGSDVALSNDRKWLVYRTAGFCNVAAVGTYFPPRLCLIDLNTKEDHCLADYEYQTPDFAPTGNWLAFSVDYSGQEEIWKAQVQPNGTLSNYVQLSRGPANQPSRAPSWSSDGNWIAFQRDVDPAETEDWQLYVVRSDGVALRALGITGESPAWLGGGPGSPPVGNETLHLPILSRQ